MFLPHAIILQTFLALLQTKDDVSTLNGDDLITSLKTMHKEELVNLIGFMLISCVEEFLKEVRKLNHLERKKLAKNEKDNNTIFYKLTPFRIFEM